MLNKLKLLTPGPTPLPEDVRLALAKDMIHHRKADFVRIMERIQPDLQYLFGTQEQVLPLSCSGTGAMYAAVSNLFTRGEKVLVVEGGKFGERWREIALSQGLEVVSLVLEAGQAISAAQVQEALTDHPDTRAVLVQASETSTGVLHPIQDLGVVTKNLDVLLMVDGISAVGISPCPMDAWHIDCLLTGSQKGLMLPPGLALLSLSSRAWDKVKTVQPENFYFNLLSERDKSLNNQTLFTSPVNLIQGLTVSLELFRQTTLEAIYSKQWALTQMARAGVASLGLELLAPTSFTWGLTAIKMPPAVDGSLVLKVAAENYNVIMAGGQGELKKSIVRLGHMGHVDWTDVLAGLYALRQGIVAAGGYLASRTFLENALHAYEQALRSGYPRCTEKEGV
ncbi:MAG: alanine--glyoxylate aminotransferase family protein [Desulfovibrionales bacterium]|nr:alanine--glyoxylate aminotransferase family protein [Desulfovibrionales bacterium]